MYEDFAPRLADLLTSFSIPIQPGDYVGISAQTEAEPLIRALYEAVLRRGGHPTVRLGFSGLDEVFYATANDAQLDFSDPLVLEYIKRVDVLYQIIAPGNTKALSSVAPARMARAQKARRPVMEAYFKRIEDKSLRWNITAWPTQAAAQEAEMGLLAYTGFMYRACHLDEADPVAMWQAMKERQAALCAWLAGKQHAHISGPGIDLHFDFGGRTWVNDEGDNNFPAGEIFTSPVEHSVQGTVSFSFPAIYHSREVSGVRLVFEQGRVVQASAAKNEEFLLSQLDLDDGARVLGEFAIGTNYGIQQFTGQTLFDEKIGGTVHMALGQGFEEAGGTNKSQIHWDMVHEMKQGGRILIDDVLFYENGQFVVAG